ncbi:hypothetical protein J3Q09_18390 [Pseudomonas sp. R4-83]|uniref:hypothetical protein n=1 Tax=unclassified Pseudomonas TaxID=196821 RepID=UPI003DA9D528
MSKTDEPTLQTQPQPHPDDQPKAATPLVQPEHSTSQNTLSSPGNGGGLDGLGGGRLP